MIIPEFYSFRDSGNLFRLKKQFPDSDRFKVGDVVKTQVFNNSCHEDDSSEGIFLAYTGYKDNWDDAVEMMITEEEFSRTLFDSYFEYDEEETNRVAMLRAKWEIEGSRPYREKFMHIETKRCIADTVSKLSKIGFLVLLLIAVVFAIVMHSINVVMAIGAVVLALTILISEMIKESLLDECVRVICDSKLAEVKVMGFSKSDV